MSDNRPNVLILQSDQHNYRYEGHREPAEGGVSVRTPTMDRLAEQGATFEQTYCPAPLCTPSRLSMLTGQRVPDAGAWENKSVLFPEHTTLPEAFSEAGYETCLVGKMHLGGDRQFVGFDNRPYGDLTGETGHQFEPLFGTSGSKVNVPKGAGKEYYHAFRDPSFNCERVREAGETEIPESLLQEQNIVRETMSFLREHRSQNPDQPWLMYASFSRPHFPLTAPERFIQEYIDQVELPDEALEDAELHMDSFLHDFWDAEEISEESTLRARAAYLACVTYLDEILDDLLTMLEKDGFLEDTIVIYTSDHGEMAGEYGLWGKVTWRESSVRVPLTVQLPAHRSGNSDPATISEPVSLIDLFPTLCGLANISAPDAVDGTDLSTAIETGQDPERPPVVSDNFVPWIEGRAFRMVRDDQYKYVRFRDGNELFFNLEEDPRENSNLLEDANSTQAAELKKLRVYVDDSLDFDAAIEQREADMSRAEEFELAIPPGHGNVYHMPDDRLVDAETPLYVPNLLTKNGPSAIADWPDADD